MMRHKKDPNVYPPGLDAAKVKRIIAYYDNQTDDEAAEEISSAPFAEPTAWIEVPLEILPRVRKLIARRQRKAG
jgi:hypothetical protein